MADSPRGYTYLQVLLRDDRVEVVAREAPRRGAALQAVPDEVLARRGHLGVGRLVASGNEAPSMLENLVWSG